jgi:hypothetical protein
MQSEQFFQDTRIVITFKKFETCRSTVNVPHFENSVIGACPIFIRERKRFPFGDLDDFF